MAATILLPLHDVSCPWFADFLICVLIFACVTHFLYSFFRGVLCLLSYLKRWFTSHT